MKVYRYWAEPKTSDDRRLLQDQLRRAAWYRRELDRIEDRARILKRSVLSLPKEGRPPWYAMIQRGERDARKRCRDLARTGFQDSLPVSWGTCLCVEDAHDHSQRTTAIHDSVASYIDPAEGLLAVQYQRHENDPKWKPVLASSLIGGTDTQVQIGADLIGRPTLRSGRTEGAKHLRELRFRIGSGDGRAPLWARLYVLVDPKGRGKGGAMPLPDKRVVWVKLSCRRYANRQRWMLLVVVDEPCVGHADPDRAGVAGIDIGWRQRPDGGIRVAYWAGSDGSEGELVIPEAVHQRRGKRDSLRSIRDRERNETGPVVAAWIRHHAPEGHPLAAAGAHAHQWLHMGKFVRLLELWRQHRLDGDEEVFATFERWLKHDRHLWTWEAHNGRRMQLQIADRVLQFAVMLARRYRAVCVEARGMIPSLVRKRKDADSGEKWQRSLNANRVALVGPAAVRQALQRTCAKYGATYLEADPAGTTSVCSECGIPRVIEDGAPLELPCEGCGVLMDQDRTAAKNLIKRAIAELVTSAEESATPKKMGIRRTRRRKPEPVVEQPATGEAP